MTERERQIILTFMEAAKAVAGVYVGFTMASPQWAAYQIAYSDVAELMQLPHLPVPAA